VEEEGFSSWIENLARGSKVTAEVPTGVFFDLSRMVSNRIATLLPYSILGLLLSFGCDRVLRLRSEAIRQGRGAVVKYVGRINNCGEI